METEEASSMESQALRDKLERWGHSRRLGKHWQAHRSTSPKSPWTWPWGRRVWF